jgi:arylsulfate sulfotransferase
MTLAQSGCPGWPVSTRRGLSRLVRVNVLPICPAVFAVLSAACADSRPPAISDLRLHEPSARAPLAGRVSFSTDEPARVSLTIRAGEHNSTSLPRGAYESQHTVPILGLQPGSEHEVVVTVADQAGNRADSEPLRVVTAPLPSDAPPFRVTTSHPERMEPGVTLFGLMKWPDGAQTDDGYGLVVAVDAAGRVVWLHRADHIIGDVRRLRNGNLLYSSNYKGIRSLLVEMDLFGEVVQRWVPRALAKLGSIEGTFVDTDSLHHDIVELPSGNFLALSTEVRSYDGYFSSERDARALKATKQIVGDVVVEFARSGAIVGRWPLLDLLDPYRIGYGSLGTGFWRVTYERLMEKPELADWAHANALSYDDRDDAMIVNLRHQDATVKIERASGRVVWILGTHDGWKEAWRPLLLKPEGPFEWAFHAHGVELTPGRTILAFDNGNSRAMPFAAEMSTEQSYSRAVEFAIDEATKQVRQAWSYGGPGEDRFFSGFLGDADHLPHTGNVLITDGARVVPGREEGGKKTPAHNWARIVEVTRTQPAEKVFELVVDDQPPGGWRIYRAERLASLLP